MKDIIIICIIGGIAGWISEALLNSENENIFLSIIVGIIGGYLGYRLFGHGLYITDNIWVNKVITATVGAIIITFALKLLRMLFRYCRPVNRYRDNHLKY